MRTDSGKQKQKNRENYGKRKQGNFLKLPTCTCVLLNYPIFYIATVFLPWGPYLEMLPKI